MPRWRRFLITHHYSEQLAGIPPIMPSQDMGCAAGWTPSRQNMRFNAEISGNSTARVVDARRARRSWRHVAARAAISSG